MLDAAAAKILYQSSRGLNRTEAASLLSQRAASADATGGEEIRLRSYRARPSLAGFQL